MTYDEFKQELYCNVSGQESDSCGQVQLFEKQDVENNDVGQFFSQPHMSDLKGKMVQDDYLCVQWNKPQPMNVRSWNVRTLYEKYKREGWQGVLPEINEELRYIPKMGVKTVGEYDTYEKCCEQLILRPLNYLRNRDLLAESIYWRFGDMALALYAQMGNVGREHVTMKIVRSMTENWKVSHQTLLTNALLNTYAKMPPRLFFTDDIRFSYGWRDGVFMPEEYGARIHITRENEEEGMKGYRLTTTSMQNGAIAIFYPGVMERLSVLLGSDYYVGFTSIHQAVIHPVHRKNPSEMQASIRHVNAVFDEKDMLTNKIYRYWRRQKKLLEVE